MTHSCAHVMPKCPVTVILSSLVITYALITCQPSSVCRARSAMSLPSLCTVLPYTVSVSRLKNKLTYQQSTFSASHISTVSPPLSPQLLLDIGSAGILAWLLKQPGCEDLANVQDIGGYTPAHDAVESE